MLFNSNPPNGQLHPRSTHSTIQRGPDHPPRRPTTPADSISPPPRPSYPSAPVWGYNRRNGPLRRPGLGVEQTGGLRVGPAPPHPTAGGRVDEPRGLRRLPWPDDLLDTVHGHVGRQPPSHRHQRLRAAYHHQPSHAGRGHSRRPPEGPEQAQAGPR